MKRCHFGETFVSQEPVTLDGLPRHQIRCVECGTVLAVVISPRNEVYGHV